VAIMAGQAARTGGAHCAGRTDAPGDRSWAGLRVRADRGLHGGLRPQSLFTLFENGMNLRLAAQSVGLFLLAGLMEIGGGYLVWLWLRESRG
jgi:hypothetical protein